MPPLLPFRHAEVNEAARRRGDEGQLDGKNAVPPHCRGQLPQCPGTATPIHRIAFMPRYFFSLMGDEPPLIDATGIHLADLEAARMSAVFEAREIMKAGLFEGSLPLHLRFEVTDAAGERLMTIPFDKTVQVRWPAHHERRAAARAGVDAARAHVDPAAAGWPVWLAACGGAVAGLSAQIIEPSASLRAVPPAFAYELSLAVAVASLAWLRTHLLRY